MVNNYQDFLLVIVNFNQEKEIAGFLKELKKNFPLDNTIIVDDGSTDSSIKIAQYFNYKIICHKHNLGVGAAIRTGINFAKLNNYKYVIIMSSNGKMRAEDLEKIISPILTKNADYVTGSRFIKGGGSPGLSLFRRAAIHIFSLLAWPIIKHRFSDITCGFRCYKIDFLFNKPININQSWLDRYELEYYIHFWACKLGLKIIEVPVIIPYTHLDKYRKSKIKPITGWWSIIRTFIFLGLKIKS